MGLFDRGKSVEQLQAEQIVELKAANARLEQQVREAEQTRERERREWDQKREGYLATQQDLITTICLLKGIPIPHEPEDRGAEGQGVEVMPKSQQRLSWPQRIASLELASRQRAAEARKVKPAPRPGGEAA